jgi:two-component system, OmpR family, alkaline phosphatase synthesis response regulator PhoP
LFTEKGGTPHRRACVNRILVVEDEKPISNLIRMSLNKAGYACTCVYDGIAAADILETERFDLILLDIMLPGADGFELMEYIRPLEIPVIFITARNSVEDKVKGLHMGADDYLVKPFEIIELLARVETVLRRYMKVGSVIDMDGLVIDTRSMIVRRDGKEIALTRKEYELLLLFVRNPGTALYRETIYERVWGSDYMGDSRTVDLHVQRIRKKVGWEDRLQAVYKVGYRLEAGGVR